MWMTNCAKRTVFPYRWGENYTCVVWCSAAPNGRLPVNNKNCIEKHANNATSHYERRRRCKHRICQVAWLRAFVNILWTCIYGDAFTELYILYIWWWCLYVNKNCIFCVCLRSFVCCVLCDVLCVCTWRMLLFMLCILYMFILYIFCGLWAKSVNNEQCCVCPLAIWWHRRIGRRPCVDHDENHILPVKFQYLWCNRPTCLAHICNVCECKIA